MKIQKLLILSDFSEVSTPLLRYGLALAQHLNARVWVQHTYSFPATISGEAYIPEDAFKNYEKRIVQEFDALKKELPALRDVQFELSCGDLVPEMNKLIESEQIDLVVIGNQGGGFITNILGSNTIKVIQHAHCPVLSVPDSIAFQPFQHMAMAMDLKATKPAVIQRIADFAQSFRARMDIIHVSEAPVAVDVNQLTHKLDKALENTSHQFFHVHTSDIDQAIAKHMEGNNDDLLILLPREHTFFDSLFQKSISRQLAYQKKVPLLSIHA
ncbi:universal stress protein [Catalinimonas niigatensis]|uniref:universal stress protein n=1 Tax=Catalinimonas niigatensis TaxID=1397264 RepID=UPI002665C866|nr:universal stress protein [Catalinimonas niigatensis]WPP49974.1 universal stress protein [Catalinimonas niigatensis]